MCSANNLSPSAMPLPGCPPPDLFVSADRMWTAALARPRCEKVVARYCGRIGIPCYLPLRREVKRYQRRNVEAFLPMFRGYLFLHLGPGDKEALAQCQRVAAVLPVDHMKEVRLVEELRSIRILELAGLQSELVVHPELAAGQEVVIGTGPMRGLRGIVEQRRSRARVTVNVEILGQAVSVDLDVGEVEADA